MFVDKVQITAKAGNGGNGIVSFRHEKFVDKGGPDGGDGGDGGDVILKAHHDENTLSAFRYKKLMAAEPGQTGSKRKKHGKNGKDLIIKVPVGTVAINEDEKILADLDIDGMEVIIAQGGKGGFGNAHFVSSRRQIPRIAEKGENGDESLVKLELKSIADIGIIGLPNAGKSTLLSVISSAKPEIANYPFTTLRPNLGMVDIDSRTSLLFADIPGLIEGASQGKGLGDDFLRHVERTKILVHLIDAYNEDVPKAYKTIIKELKDYKIDLSGRPQIVVLTKIEGLDDEIINDQTNKLKKIVPKKTKITSISALSRQGVKEFLYEVKKLHTSVKPKKTKTRDSDLPVVRHSADQDDWSIEKVQDGFIVKGKKIERFVSRVDIESEYGEQRVFDIMKKMGIARELRRQGLEPGNKIHFGKNKTETLSY